MLHNCLLLQELLCTYILTIKKNGGTDKNFPIFKPLLRPLFFSKRASHMYQSRKKISGVNLNSRSVKDCQSKLVITVFLIALVLREFELSITFPLFSPLGIGSTSQTGGTSHQTTGGTSHQTTGGKT